MCLAYSGRSINVCWINAWMDAVASLHKKAMHHNIYRAQREIISLCKVTGLKDLEPYSTIPQPFLRFKWFLGNDVFQPSLLNLWVEETIKEVTDPHENYHQALRLKFVHSSIISSANFILSITIMKLYFYLLKTVVSLNLFAS